MHAKLPSNSPKPCRCGGAGGSGGPGRGAGGWRQGQGGPRDRPLRAAGSRVAISRAGRHPPAHTAAGPHSRAPQPGPTAGASGARNTRGGHKQPGPAGRAKQPGPAGRAKQPGPAGRAKQPGPAGRAKQPGPAGVTNQNLRNWAASRPTARSTRNAILKSPGHPQCRRRNAPRARQATPR